MAGYIIFSYSSFSDAISSFSVSIDFWISSTVSILRLAPRRLPIVTFLIVLGTTTGPGFGVGSSVSGISGIAAGYKAEEEKEKGNKKKARLISAGSLAIPILGHTPELGSEISASSKAMKMIKAAGANKKQINTARKSLGYALGTYGVDLGKHLIINGGSQLIGKGVYKLTHRKKKEDKKEENLDKNPTTVNLEKTGVEVR